MVDVERELYSLIAKLLNGSFQRRMTTFLPPKSHLHAKLFVPSFRHLEPSNASPEHTTSAFHVLVRNHSSAA
jgi:hypothetical protein